MYAYGNYSKAQHADPKLNTVFTPSRSPVSSFHGPAVSHLHTPPPFQFRPPPQGFASPHPRPDPRFPRSVWVESPDKRGEEIQVNVPEETMELDLGMFVANEGKFFSAPTFGLFARVVGTNARLYRHFRPRAFKSKKGVVLSVG